MVGHIDQIKVRDTADLLQGYHVTLTAVVIQYIVRINSLVATGLAAATSGTRKQNKTYHPQYLCKQIQFPVGYQCFLLRWKLTTLGKCSVQRLAIHSEENLDEYNLCFIG